MKTVYIITESQFGLDLDDIKVGDRYILIERSNIITGKTEYQLFKDNCAGIGGNMDSSIKRYHGWRGTTNDIAVYAHGLRRIERVDSIKENSVTMERTVKVKISADLVPDLP